MIKFLCVSKTVKGGSGGMLPQKIFKIRMLRLAENEFHTTKFPDLSLTISPCIEVPDISRQVFQVAGHPGSNMKTLHLSPLCQTKRKLFLRQEKQPLHVLPC